MRCETMRAAQKRPLSITRKSAIRPREERDQRHRIAAVEECRRGCVELTVASDWLSTFGNRPTVGPFQITIATATYLLRCEDPPVRQ
jgi:hypothetical protein